MAEGILKFKGSDIFDVFSAGSNPTGYVHPKAIDAMKEIGIDISNHKSKSLGQFFETGINTVITVCDNANDACSVFSGNVNRYHWGFQDPAKVTGTEEEITAAFRNIRDRIDLVFSAFLSGYRQGKVS